ncbi:MAG: MotA/TolQ/ExbB proton channel family protein [Methylicorpusculum sp.]|uniref:MotA/TolQ/ExbB proton channel family protein n=1 Tax=Methylicorpusculum sp. TaxID=2713644 RepID=UPI00271AE124|nr:MotA/TolQ/ExbB proton channel family protein [Methylicorpusculum sp.]MDO8941431.1 MotA/TolQ/ExbB proton channel family protein [Methylicorpusculum sp.]MDP2178594.1 MotA/TolQ/ExbB proton channel family protein [Methylicorpusculum sp.]MDP2202995.1 MotA/TolQ/ExbB proton channel family protein [Methylicorpusculum sp.]MDP3530619.1 MotA/TolQ/ExbB proton channel family protein [Methylicorpusculum sp.]MDZ4153206.1 MotA/TolQ/ExbB proton channel family protein [Methylicorpusculum sp.]
MDIASLVGFLLGIGIIAAAIVTGGDVMMFVDVPSILIVFGGTFGVSLMRIPLSDFLRSFGVLAKAFLNKRDDPNALIEEGVRLSDIARKNGLLALEGETITNEFLKKGISLCVDGHDPAFVKRMLEQEISQMVARNEVGQDMWKGVGDLAPAMGMIGTLVGLVQMLANMSDPAAIGPAMAVALLTTLYGAMVANCFALPMVDKLAKVLLYEKTNRELILETISGIQEGMNPKVLEALLNSYISDKKRKAED